MFSAEARMLTESGAVSEAEAVSVALTVKFFVPAAVGMPLICPEELRFNPAGKAPELIDHV